MGVFDLGHTGRKKDRALCSQNRRRDWLQQGTRSGSGVLICAFGTGLCHKTKQETPKTHFFLSGAARQESDFKTGFFSWQTSLPKLVFASPFAALVEWAAKWVLCPGAEALTVPRRDDCPALSFCLHTQGTWEFWVKRCWRLPLFAFKRLWTGMFICLKALCFSNRSCAKLFPLISLA